MRNNSQDQTLKKNYIQKYQFLIQEYEQVKAGEHPRFRFVKDFYAFHGTCPQTFLSTMGVIGRVDPNRIYCRVNAGLSGKHAERCPRSRKKYWP